MSDVVELRRKSALFRQIANISTSGGGSADRVLFHLAELLDYEANSASFENQSDPRSPKPSTAGGTDCARRWRAS